MKLYLLLSPLLQQGTIIACFRRPNTRRFKKERPQTSRRFLKGSESYPSQTGDISLCSSNTYSTVSHRNSPQKASTPKTSAELLDVLTFSPSPGQDLERLFMTPDAVDKVFDLRPDLIVHHLHLPDKIRIFIASVTKGAHIIWSYVCGIVHSLLKVKQNTRIRSWKIGRGTSIFEEFFVILKFVETEQRPRMTVMRISQCSRA